MALLLRHMMMCDNNTGSCERGIGLEVLLLNKHMQQSSDVATSSDVLLGRDLSTSCKEVYQPADWCTCPHLEGSDMLQVLMNLQTLLGSHCCALFVFYGCRFHVERQLSAIKQTSGS